MMTVVEGELPGRAAPSVLAELFRAHYSNLVGLARLLDRDDAEELVQEAFVRVHAGWDGVRDRSDPLPYVRQVVVNLARSRGRHKAVVARHLRSVATTGTAADPTGASDERRVVRAALDRLPRRQRECVALRYLLDCSTEQTAEILGISPGSVKTHLHRGLAAMEATLKEER